MNCPYCKSPGFPRGEDVYTNHASKYWVCVKCPNPVTYSSDENKVCLWSLHNGVWYSVVYMKINKKYLICKENFEATINQEESKEEWIYKGGVIFQVPSEENITPENIKEKLSLMLTFS